MHRFPPRLLTPALALVLAGGSAAAGTGTLRVEDVFPAVPACGTRHADAMPSPVAPRPDGGGVRAFESPAPAFSVVRPDGDTDLALMRWEGLLADPVTEDIPLIVRSRAVGITVRAATAESLLVSVELVSPDGALLSCFECPDPPAASEVRIGRGTVQVPSTDRPGWELEAGEYAFRVRVLPPPTRGAPSARVDVTATFRTDEAVTVDHLLDLNFVYLPGCTLSGEIATTHPRFAALLDTVDAYMEPTGIRIGNVTHVDLDRPEFSQIATWEEAGEMFRTSRNVGKPRALNVYCVEKFVAPLNPVVGLAGGIPGPAENGTRDSGIAVRMSPFFTCTDCLNAFGSLFAHEIGHYLGFYHTSETDLQSWDPFSDTPECPPDIGGLGSCPDHDYVMFPQIHSLNTIWSPAQVGVAVTHPLVRTVAVVGGEPARGRGPALPPTLAVAPNPFRDEVRVGWAAPGPVASAAVGVYDVTGRLVRSLGGRAEVTWDGRDGRGRVVAPGTYFVRVRAGNEVRAARVVRLP